MAMKVDKNKRPVIFEAKEAGGEKKHTEESEVMAEVAKEIKALGDNTKEAMEVLQRTVKKMQGDLDATGGKLDALDESKFSKQAEDILSRQEALEADTTKRMDEIDLALQRGLTRGGGDTTNEVKEFEEAVDFTINAMIVRKEIQLGKTREQIADSVDIEMVKGYKKTFDLYMRKGDRLFTPEESKLLSIGSDPDGGVLVTPAVSARIVERIREMDPIREMASVETIGTDALEIHEDLDEAGDGWADETTANDETSTPKLNKVRIPVHVQEARPRATQMLLDDATRNMEQWLANKVARKFGRTEGAAFVTGDGIGKPRGFLTYSAWSVAGTFEFGKVEQQNMGHASQLTTDGFIDVLYRLLEEYQRNAIWLMNRLAVRDTMKLKDGDGQYVWRPGLQEGQPAVILAHPVRMSTTMPVVTTNSLSVAIADWREAYTVVDRQGISVLRDPFTVKPLVEFYTRRRIGGDVVNFQAIKIGKVAA